MRHSYQANRQSRLGAVAVSFILQAGLVVVLIAAFAPSSGLLPQRQGAIDAISVAIRRDKTPPPPPAATASGRESAPAGAKAQAAPVFAAKTPVPATNPIAAAVVPAQAEGLQGGNATSGQGSGSGGAGNGTGGSGGGDGAGSAATEPDWIGGKIADRDYPKEAKRANIGGTTRTRLAVGADGRVSACSVTGSSGSKLLDDTTCRLIVQRFRFTPARDAAGTAVSSSVNFDHDWYVPPAPPED